MKRLTLLLLSILVSRAVNAQQQQHLDSVPPLQGWGRLTTGTKAYFSSLSVIGRDTVYASGAAILRSTDAGATWDSMTTWPGGGGILKYIDDTTGFLISGDSHIQKTTNAGSTWRAIPANVSTAISWPIVFATHDSGWVGQTLIRTTNAGESWIDYGKQITATGNALVFTDSKHGFVMGRVQGYLPDPRRPGAAAYGVTTDGGVTWTEEYSGLPRQIEALAVIKPGKLIAVGDRIVAISKNNAYLKWDTLPPFSNVAAFFGVIFPDSLHGTIVGTDGIEGWILHTSDGAQTWQRQNSGVTHGEYLYSVAFVDSLTGYVVGDSGVILKTINGGLSWVRLLNNSSVLQGTTFPNPASNTSVFAYSLNTPQHVTLSVLDITGKLVLTVLQSQFQPGGIQTVPFDVSQLPSGSYRIVLKSEDYSSACNLTVVH